MGKKERKEKAEKPLEKMTAKELREMALSIPEIVGVHGMNKEELLAAVKKARGIEDVVKKKSHASIRDLKKKIRELKAKREEARKNRDRKLVDVLRKRISRLKKMTRRAA
ncbi:MAG TPA: transcription termination factor Rho [Syntrophaceae bacterium]|nr:transcription termination factor Rho [Syntrophaceae bacterium]